MADETITCCDGLVIALKHWHPVVTANHTHTASSSTASTSRHFNHNHHHHHHHHHHHNYHNRVLCLHGYLDNCESFHYLAPFLAKHASCEVVAMDLPGHGWSQHKPRDGPTHVFADSIFYIREVVDKLGWSHAMNMNGKQHQQQQQQQQPSQPKFTLVGHSAAGAGTAALYAATYPDQVQQLILLEGSAPRSVEEEKTSQMVRAHVEKRRSMNPTLSHNTKSSSRNVVFDSLEAAVKARQKAVRGAPGMQYISKRAATALVSRGTTTTTTTSSTASSGGGAGAATRKKSSRHSQQQQQVCYHYRHDVRLTSGLSLIQYYSPAQVEALLRSIQCPTALLVAEDGMPMRKMMDKTLLVLSPMLTETLPGSHYFHADPDTAREVAEAVWGFMNQHGGSSNSRRGSGSGSGSGSVASSIGSGRMMMRMNHHHHHHHPYGMEQDYKRKELQQQQQQQQQQQHDNGDVIVVTTTAAGVVGSSSRRSTSHFSNDDYHDTNKNMAAAAAGVGMGMGMAAAAKEFEEIEVEDATTTTFSQDNHNDNVVDIVDRAPPLHGSGGGGGKHNNNDHNPDMVDMDEYCHDYYKQYEPSKFANGWAQNVEAIQQPFIDVIVATAKICASNPWRTVVFILVFSFGVLALGFGTSFYIEDKETILWTPQDSKAFQHGQWIESGDAGFPLYTAMVFMIHTNREDGLLTIEGMNRVFEVLDDVRQLDGYDELCDKLDESLTYVDQSGRRTCRISSPTEFWHHNSTIFAEQVGDDNDQEKFIAMLSNTTYPSGAPVDRDNILGYAETDTGEYNGTIVDAASYAMAFVLPEDPKEERNILEKLILDHTLAMRDDWADDDENIYTLEVFSLGRSFSDEFGRAIVRDIPLVPGVFFLMSAFCCFVFARRDLIKSQGLLGIGAVVGVFLSIATSYGLVMLCGVPFTSLTQILPFIAFGIGLDDAFIIIGSYARTDPAKDTVLRIEETMLDCGGSILITTLTSTIAFGLGAISSVPAVHWLCLYAFPTIMIDFIYQVTFFVALITIDEKRMQDGRIDFFVWRYAKGHGPNADPTTEEEEEEEASLEEENDERTNNNDDDNDQIANTQNNSIKYIEEDVHGEERQQNFAERFMATYADILLTPTCSAFVLLIFGIVLVITTFNALALTQKFNFTDILPKDSYVADYVRAKDEYTSRTLANPGLYFRDVDFSKKEIQNQMMDYVDTVVDMEEVSAPPIFFWLRDFHYFLSLVPYFEFRPFEEQLDAFMDIPVLKQLHGSNIVRADNGTGTLTASRTFVAMSNVDDSSVTDQIEALNAVHDVDGNQQVNEGESDWKFFMHDINFYIWSFYAVTEGELVLTTVVGVISVSIIAALFIPHWSAALFVTPLVCMLYVELLGVYHLAGLYVNSVTYVSIVMSIGLMVDYVMHVVIRYYESTEMTREDKVRDTLTTMGASILIGGLTTMIGVIPLAFASSNVFSNVFIGFVSLVTLGVTNGLALLPVVLSIIGPEGVTGHNHLEGHEQQQQEPASPVTAATSSSRSTKSQAKRNGDESVMT